MQSEGAGILKITQDNLGGRFIYLRESEPSGREGAQERESIKQTLLSAEPNKGLALRALIS